MLSNVPAVVIDNGSGTIKAGIAGEEAPKAIFPSVVGMLRSDRQSPAEEKEFYVGHEAIKKRGLLTLENPLESGIVKNWDYMTKIWYTTFMSELKVEPSNQPVLLSEAPMNPKENREKSVEVFFETFKVPSFYIYSQAVLGMYATGRTTGTIIDSGEGSTNVVVVYYGYSIKHAISKIDFAGKALTEFMKKSLSEDGLSLVSANEKDVPKTIKEKLCYVPLDYEMEMRAFDASPERRQDFEMPDGQVIRVGNALIRTPECLFNPKLLNIESRGLHETVADCVKRADLEMRKELFENITLSGGNTMFEGLSDRLTKEVGALVPPAMKVKVLAPVERKFSVWIGGSALATLSNFQSSWITRSEFEEAGPSIVQRKCY